MENKKTFGAYICRRRKELGLTQREFADRLFVTESAVSKWERGMSYPDITLIRDICAILQVSEHELLTASEDVEAGYVLRYQDHQAGDSLDYGATVTVVVSSGPAAAGG